MPVLKLAFLVRHGISWGEINLVQEMLKRSLERKCWKRALIGSSSGSRVTEGAPLIAVTAESACVPGLSLSLLTPKSNGICFPTPSDSVWPHEPYTLSVTGYRPFISNSRNPLRSGSKLSPFPTRFEIPVHGGFPSVHLSVNLPSSQLM